MSQSTLPASKHDPATLPKYLIPAVEALLALDAERSLEHLVRLTPQQAAYYAKRCRQYNAFDSSKLSAMFEAIAAIVPDEGPCDESAGWHYHVGCEYSPVVHLHLPRFHTWSRDHGMDYARALDVVREIEKAAYAAGADEFHIVRFNYDLEVRIWWD